MGFARRLFGKMSARVSGRTVTAAEPIPQELIQLLRNSKRCVVLTGAGLSAESGIPTFRDAQKGMWAKFDPMTLASPEGFEADPSTVSRWYKERREMCKAVEPNPGHIAIAQLGKFFSEYTVITQLVDSMHQRAGWADTIELHGSLSGMKRHSDGVMVPEDKWEEDEDTGIFYEAGTKEMLRPAVVWFNEQLPPEAYRRSEAAAEQCDVIFSVGTSSIVYPAASLPLIALGNGAKIIEVNTERTRLSPNCAFTLLGKSGDILPRIVEAMETGNE